MVLLKATGGSAAARPNATEISDAGRASALSRGCAEHPLGLQD